jgi:hypothetical protein
MEYNMNSPETLAIINDYNNIQPLPARLILPTEVEEGHIAIGGSGNIVVTPDLRACEWNTIYQNMTEDIPFFLMLGVRPLLVANAACYCMASLWMGSENPPATRVSYYVGTNFYSTLILTLDAGTLSAWIPPLCYYKITYQYTANLTPIAVRYWLADVSGNLPPLS